MKTQEEIYRGKKISLYREKHLMPNGKTSDYEVVRHPGAVVMLPVAEDGRLYLLKQYRPALSETILEFPAGTLESGEEPLSTAKRELEEEIGMEGREWHDLGILYPAPGFCDEKQFCYLVRSLSPKSRPGDEDELLEPFLVSVSEVENMIREGELVDAKSLAIFSKARLLKLL